MSDANPERPNSARVWWGIGLSWIALAVLGVLLWKAISRPPQREPLPPVDDPASKAVPSERYPLPPEIANALRGAKSLEIYLLGVKEAPEDVPDFNSAEVPKLPENVGFPDSNVLGSTRIQSPRAVASIVEKLIQGTKHDRYVDFGCFLPRHAIRVELADGRRIDLVVCFACQIMKIYSSGPPIDVQTLDDARQPLNEALQAAGVDLNQPVAPFLPKP